MSRSAGWPLIGRQTELGEVESALAADTTRAVLLVGTSGVGKTRLANAVCATRPAQTIIRVVGTPEGRNFPLAALAPLLIKGPPPATPLPHDPVGVLARVQAVIEAIPGRRCLLFIDDLPLLDPLSAVVVSQILDSGSAVLLATVRTGDPLPEMYQRRWSDLGVVRVQIEPLAEAECGVLLGRAVGGPVATKAVGRFHTLSGGNPLHLKELLRAVIDDGTFTPVAGVWQLAAGPVGSTYLTELVADHLHRLTPAEAGLIRRIALCQPLDLADFNPQDAEQLDGLERRGLIRVDPAEAEFAVRLAHPGYAEILTGQTSRLETRRILLQQIELVQARDRGPRDLLRLSLWQLAANGRADPALLVAAATTARQGHEFALVRQLATAAVSSQQQPTAEALLLLGEAQRELGDRDAATRTLDSAAQAAGPPATHAKIALARAGLAGHGRNRPDQAVAILTTARASIPDAHAFLSLARTVMLSVGERIDEALAELALIEPAEARQPDLAGLYSIAAMGALLAAGRPQEALAIGEEWLPQITTGNGLIHDGMPLMLRAAALLDLHGPTQALPDATAAMRQCLDSGVDRLICYAASQLFTIHLDAGRPKTASRWARELISVARTAQHASFVRLGLSSLATALALTGDLAGARSQLHTLAHQPAGGENWPGPPPSSEIRAHAWTSAIQGELSAARSLLRDGAEQAAARGHWSAAGQLLHDAARLGAGPAATADMAHVASRCPSPQVQRQHRHLQALHTDQPNLLTDIAEDWTSTGHNLLAAETFLAAATQARQLGLTRRAAALTARGSDLAAHCQGATTPGLTAANPVDPLSPREHEIAQLASQGLRSRDIAQKLVMSTRTVDNHLQAAYTKLGITGRRELAGALKPRPP